VIRESVLANDVMDGNRSARGGALLSAVLRVFMARENGWLLSIGRERRYVEGLGEGRVVLGRLDGG
jgi:hypothetical protein